MRKTNIRSIFTIPNALTFLRMVGSFVLFFTAPLSPLYYGVYTVSGLSDALDGFVARLTGSATEFGARLDSISDLLFYTAMGLTLLPKLWAILPLSIWIGIACIMAIRVSAYLVAAIKYKRFASMHTWLNKLTSALIFMTPYFMEQSFFIQYSVAVSIIAALASLEELAIHISSPHYNPQRKTWLTSPEPSESKEKTQN